MTASPGTVAGASRSDVVSLLAIEVTIIVAVPDTAQLAGFYERAYSEDPAASAAHARWRALGAIGKANHVVALCARAGIRPTSTLEVGCGDGALLCELRARRFGGRLHGAEISQAAVAIARSRPQIDAVLLYDGAHLAACGGAYDLGILSHVLEHVPDPVALLKEVARACRAVVLEVPLEANWSARRASRRARAAEIGHLQRLDRGAVREIASRARLAVACELEDPLPLEVHLFFAAGPRGRASAAAKWALRNGLHHASSRLARRLFTVHYACLCLPDG
ncbi:MAG: class I SAM-dependent methyltransferase [Actinobacteria bacterium]|nr:MAG: class I SAM-dependent methyltransferase [Actinomycetota bacterium]